ncbi:MAG: YihY/virulence factor BrkB family protein [Novosphingobium sp.]|nr:YihY/virulence factor BrkB family protein [Novosphingobium sp.]MBO9603430.1 YihY/virulence factor BrkB family protein [Novosphingobium sp.]
MLPAIERSTGVARVLEVTRRTFSGTWNDGFIHAGNLAYVTLFAIFPFFIFGAALFSLLGEDADRSIAITSVLRALPSNVAEAIGPDARAAINARSGWLLAFGALASLWTVGGLVETIRDILRRAYGTRPTRSFWWYRLTSAGIIVGAVMLLVLGLVTQVLIGTIEEVIDAWFPQLLHWIDALTLSRIVPVAAVYCSIFLLFLSLTPHRYRGKRYHKWPGALLVTLWWLGVTLAFPPLLRSLFSYSLTYGSLAGIMITLFFFWLIGLGMVAGAELNAVLAVSPEEEGIGTSEVKTT